MGLYKSKTLVGTLKEKSKKSRRKDPLKPLGDLAMGSARLGITTAVGSSVVGKAAAQLPAAQQASMAPIQGSFGTVAGFAPIVITAGAGKAVLDIVKPKKKKKRYY